MKNIPTNKPSLDPLRAAPASVRLSDAEQIDYLIMDAVETRLAKGEPISDMARFKAGCRKAILENEKQYRGYVWKLYAGTRDRRENGQPVQPSDDVLLEYTIASCRRRMGYTMDGMSPDARLQHVVDAGLEYLPPRLRSPEIEERIRKELAA